MTLTVTTDHETIAARLDAILTADPVRGTVLGTIRAGLQDSAWCAMDGAALAVRSEARFPVYVTGGWHRAGGTELAALATLLDDLRGLAGFSGTAADVHAVVAALHERRPREVAVRAEQRLFRLDEVRAPTVPGHAGTAVEAHRDLLAGWYSAFGVEAHASLADIEDALRRALGGGCWLWFDPDGTPVSMAFRRAAMAGCARIGPVYTPPELRGHGYASAVTAAATRDVLGEGAIPVLFTDLANPVSNAIYQRLGYYAVDDFAFVRYD